MLKKIVLSIVAMALLLGIESLIAQERKGKPEEKQKQKAQAKQLHEQQLCKKAGRKREEGEIIEQRPPVFGPMQNWPIIRERFNIWFNKLTKAYHENDREKIGQLLRRMQQFRQRLRKGRGALGEHRRDFLIRPGIGRGQAGTGRGRPWQFRGDLGRWGRAFPRRGMRRCGRGFQRRGVGQRGQGMPLMPSEAAPSEGMCRPEIAIPPRDMGKPGPYLRRRGINTPRWDDVPGSEWNW